jgi:hypothetical protein
MIAGQLEIQLYADVARIKADMDRAQSAVSGAMSAIDKSIGVAKAALGGLISGLAAGISVAAFTQIVKSSVESAAALHDLSIQTGATVEALTGLASVGKYSDVGAQQIATSMNLLAKNMAGATDESRGAGKAIEALGINFETFKRLSPDQQMQMVAKAMDKFEDGTGKSAVAMALYGKEGAKLLPFLKDLAQTGELQAKVTTEQAAMADNFSDNLLKLKSSGDAWKKELAMGILPAMNDLSEAWLATMNGSGGLRAEIRKLSADGTLDEWARDAIKALTFVMNAGEGAARVFIGIGKTIGAAAAQMVAVGTGDLKGAINIGKAWSADLDDLLLKPLLGDKLFAAFEKTANAKKQAIADYQQAVSDVMKAYAGYDLKTQQAAMVALRDAYFGEDKKGLDFTNIADKGGKEKVSEYEKLIRAINEKIAAEKMEAETAGALTDGQKLALKTMVDLRDGTLKLTEKEKIRLAGMLNLLLLEEQNADAKKLAAKATLEAAQAHVKYIDAMAGDLKKLQENVEAQRVHNAEIGLSKEAIAALEAAKLEDQATTLEGIAIKKLDKDLDEQQYDLYKAQAKALRDLADQKRLGATKQAMVDMVDDATKESQKSFEDMSRALTDSLMRGGKNAGEYLKDYFRTLVLRPVIQGAVNIGLNAVGMNGGSAAGNIFQGANLVNAGSNLYSAATSMSSFGNTAGQLYQYGSTLASGGTAAVSTGVGGTGWVSAEGGEALLSSSASSFGSTLATAAPYLAAAAAIYSIVKGFDHSGTKHTGGAATASAGGSSTIDARALGFMDIATTKDANTAATGLATGIVNILNGTAATFGKQAGYIAATAFADDTSKDGAWGALLIQKGGKDLINWDANRQSRWAPREYADGEAGRNQYLAELAGSVRTALDDIGLPGWAKSMLNALGDAPSITDLGAVVDKINATQTALVALGKAIPGFSKLNDQAVSALINASGGPDAMASAANSYYESFYSDSEKVAFATKQVSDALSGLNLKMPATKEGFRALVESQIALGVEGAPAVAALLKLAGAFDTVTTAADRIASSRSGLEAQILELQGRKGAALAITRAQELKAMDESLRPLQKRVWALQDEKDAIENAKKIVSDQFGVLQRAVDRERDAATKAHDKAMEMIQGRIDDVTKSVDKLKGLSDSLKATVDKMRLPSEAGADRAAASAQIAAALAIARAGGVLPDADSLRSALDIVSQPNEQLYKTFVDFQRDFMVDRNNVSALSELTDSQLSVEERSLKTLEDQKKLAEQLYTGEMQRLDGILSAAQLQIDALNGIDISIKSVEVALTAFNAAVNAAKTASATASTRADINPDGSALMNQITAYGATNGVNAPLVIPGINDYAEKMRVANDLVKLGAYSDTASAFQSAYGTSQSAWEKLQNSIPKFAAGGDHLGGLRIVGERGWEIEATGPARYWNASQTARMLSGGGGDTRRLEGLVVALTKEVEKLRAATDKGNEHLLRTANAVNGNPEAPMLVETAE